MHSPLVEMRGLAAIDGKVVVVGQATQEKDHGAPCWLCSTLPPQAQRHEVVKYRQQAIDWLKQEARAEQVFEGVLTD